MNPIISEEQKLENTKLWESVCTTDPKMTKQAKGKTAIDPMYRILKMTEIFGPYGSNWGVEKENFNLVTMKEKTFCAYSAILFFKHKDSINEVPIHSDIEVIGSKGKLANTYITDWAKKVATDALTKGLSKIGVCADVFMGKFEDEKYVGYAQQVAEKENYTKNISKMKKVSQEQIINIYKILKDTGTEAKDFLLKYNDMAGTSFPSVAEIPEGWYKHVVKNLNENGTKSE